MYKRTLRLTIEQNKKDLAEWSSMLLLSEGERLTEIIKCQIDDMKDENNKLREELECLN